MSVSVIIVNYFSSESLTRAISSLINEHTIKEIYVVDNSASVRERQHLEQLSGCDRLNLLFNEKNEGFARACNRAFRLSEGEYIFLLNPDAYVLPGCIKRLYHFMESEPTAAAASPRLYWDDNQEYLFSFHPLLTPMTFLMLMLSARIRVFGKLYSLYIRSRNLKLWTAKDPLEVDNLSGGTVMLRRSVLGKEIFDERFFLFYEDTDLFYRLKRDGYRVFVIPDAVAVHSYHHSREKSALMSASLALYMEKHLRKSPLIRPDHFPRNSCTPSGLRDYGSWKSPPTFEVPEDLKDDYLFEWSPNPIFIPSVGYFGRGDLLSFSDQIWNLIDIGVYYCRFTSPSRRFTSYETLRWRKVQ